MTRPNPQQSLKLDLSNICIHLLVSETVQPRQDNHIEHKDHIKRLRAYIVLLQPVEQPSFQQRLER